MRMVRGLGGLGVPAADRAKTNAALALTLGNFDGVHRAHRAMLERTVEAAADLNLTPAVLTFHPSPKEFFALRAGAGIVSRLSTLSAKLQRIREAGIEQVIIARFDAQLAMQSGSEFIESVLAERLNVRWLLVGDDFRFGHKRAGTIEMLRGASMFTVERMHTVMVDGERVSSTSVRAALQSGDMETATRLLGRPYSIAGRVAHGEKLGRTLGFPTANVPLRFTPALSGVFVVKVAGLDGRTLHGVASLGTRPTVNATTRPLLEVFLFDFDASIYGRRICVSFLKKLRDEAHFPDVAVMREQIARDADEARAYVSQITATSVASRMEETGPGATQVDPRAPFPLRTHTDSRIAGPAGQINA